MLMVEQGSVADCTKRPWHFRHLEGNYFFADIMAHEMAHMRNHFGHNWKFADKNKKHMITVAEWFISGKFYLDKAAAKQAEEVKINGT